MGISSSANSGNNVSSVYITSVGGNGESGGSARGNGGGFIATQKNNIHTSLANLYTQPKEHINYYTMIPISEDYHQQRSSHPSLQPHPNLAVIVRQLLPPLLLQPIRRQYPRVLLSHQDQNDTAFSLFTTTLSKQQDECEFIVLVQSACQLLGVTYR